MSNRKSCVRLLRVLQKTYDHHPNLREYLDKSMIEICRAENVSPHQALFILSDCNWQVVVTVTGLSLQ